MPEIDPVILQLRADVAKYNADMQQTARRVDASLKLQEGSIVRLEGRMTTGFERVGGAATRAQMLVGSSMNAIKGAMAGVSAIAIAQSFLKIADEAKKLDATLKLATSGFGSFGQAQEDVRRIADETRSGLSETASLYANFVRGAKELGGSQAEAARATETFSKTLKISGADANSAASATLQFGQALASGALRGDELNSILEASPRLARLLADAMGQPIGQIKKLGEEGKLTSDKLLRALTDTKFTASIDAEFKELPVTFDDAMTKVYNAALVTFSAFDRGGQFSTALANFVTDGADGFGDMERAAERFGISTREQFNGLYEAVSPFLALLQEIRSTLAYIETHTPKAAKITPEGAATGVDAVTGLWRKPQAFGRGLYSAATGGSFRKGYDDFMSQTSAAQYVRDARGRIDQKNTDAEMARIMRGNPLRDAATGLSKFKVPSTGDKAKKKAGAKSPLSPEAFAREEASLNDQILRLKTDETQTAEQRAKIETDRIEAARLAANAEVELDKRYTQPQKEKIVALNDQVAALRAAKVIQERDAEVAQRTYDLETAANRSAQDLLESQSDITTNRREQYEIEKRILKLKQSQERAELERLRDSQKPEERDIGRAGLAKLDAKQANEDTKLAQQYEGPLGRYRRKLNDTDIHDQVEQYAVDELEHVQDGIRDALTKKLGIKDPFLAGILDMFIQQVIMKPLANAFAGASGGGGGGIGGIFGSLLSGLGGIFGGGGGGGGAITGGGSSFSFPGLISGFGGGRFDMSGTRVPGFAGGTPYAPGGMALVGERGPELVNLPRGSRVTPNHQLAGAAARGMVGAGAASSPRNVIVQQTVHVDASNSVNPAGFESRILSVSAAQAQQAAAAAYQQSMKDAPGAVRRAQRFRTT
ncbi:tape measure protein [Sphingobium sp. AN558]|uniref:tape measure protein n=1 Tax=Sphingobium sp. AN558 TaxID=3133442 RepID=UPI0030BD06A6